MQNRIVVLNARVANALAQAGFGAYTIMNTENGVRVRREDGTELAHVTFAPTGRMSASMRTDTQWRERRALVAGMECAKKAIAEQTV